MKPSCAPPALTVAGEILAAFPTMPVLTDDGREGEEEVRVVASRVGENRRDEGCVQAIFNY